MDGKGIVIAALCMVIFVSMLVVTIQASNRQEDTKYCEWGEPLIKNNRMIGCQHDSGYIGDDYS